VRLHLAALDKWLQQNHAPWVVILLGLVCLRQCTTSADEQCAMIVFTKAAQAGSEGDTSFSSYIQTPKPSFRRDGDVYRVTVSAGSVQAVNKGGSPEYREITADETHSMPVSIYPFVRCNK
jgi:hypothetical protein